MATESYIQVILPLKLDWEPYYRLPEDCQVKLGDRVRVLFARAFYVACVSQVQVTPSLDPGKIQAIEGVEKDLPAITPQEIAFWREIAKYYLCTLGEVYKAAYPSITHHKSRLTLPQSQPLKDDEPLSSAQEKAVSAIGQAFEDSKTVLLNGVDCEGKTAVCLKLVLNCLREGRSVLFLVPEIALSGALEQQLAQVVPSLLVYHSGLGPAKRKQVAEKLRTGEPCLVLGTRSALFLPHHSLGLIIVDQEHDPAYKQDAPAPRYHARESAIMLAAVHGARVLLCSATPSLESIYNASCGRFIQFNLKEFFAAKQSTQTEIINIAAEARKRGMAGSFSLKLLSAMRSSLDAGERILLLGPRRSYAQGRKLEDDVLEFFPNARIAILDMGPADGEYDIYIGTAHSAKAFQCKKLGLIAVVGMDGILSRQDFRADEHAIQLLEHYRSRCRHFIVQTREPGHPVFAQLNGGEIPVTHLLQERAVVAYPPYTRLVSLQIRDSNPKRLKWMSQELARQLQSIGGRLEGPFGEETQEIRILLPRDKALVQRKAAIGKTVTAFEQARKYVGHIVIDVDPV